MIWDKIKALKLRWGIGFVFCIVVYSITPSFIENDMAHQFANNLIPDRYTNEGFLILPNKEDYPNASGVYHLCRFYEEYLIGDVNEEYIENAENWFEISGNQKALNDCWQISSYIKSNETEKLKLYAESVLEKYRPYYGRDLKYRYYLTSSIICIVVLLITFSAEIKHFLFRQ